MSLAFIRFLKGFATPSFPPCKKKKKKSQLANHWPIGAVSCIIVYLSLKLVVNLFQFGGNYSDFVGFLFIVNARCEEAAFFETSFS